MIVAPDALVTAAAPFSVIPRPSEPAVPLIVPLLVIVAVPDALTTAPVLAVIRADAALTREPPARPPKPLSSVPLLVSVVPDDTLADVSTHEAPASIVTWAKLTNWLPRPLSVPLAAADASSSVLAILDPIVLPPLTVPVKAALGETISRLL